MLDCPVLTGPLLTAPPFVIEETDDPAPYWALRHQTFVDRQGLFARTDRDEVDDDPRTVVLLARSVDGTVLGGVRLGPVTESVTGADIGWWRGGRLVSDGRHPGVGAALVRAACAHAEGRGVLRFDAHVQSATYFRALGWEQVGTATIGGRVHATMNWPIGRIQRLVAATKSDLGALLAGVRPGPVGFVGDDGAPVPGTDVIVACDAILPAMVERDPYWAGWCGVLVNLNDLAAMGAAPLGLVDAVAGRDVTAVAEVLAGMRAAATAWGVQVLGGHTQTGTPAALSITALGQTSSPVPAGGGKPGDAVFVTADTGGGWRPGYTGRQWDSTSHRSPQELRGQQSAVARARPGAAKDVSMAGLVGTLGMLAEASGTGAILDVVDVPRPADATVGDWLTCFPGYAMVSTCALDATAATSARCGTLTDTPGVALRWPDGALTTAVTGPVTGLGRA